MYREREIDALFIITKAQMRLNRLRRSSPSLFIVHQFVIRAPGPALIYYIPRPALGYHHHVVESEKELLVF